MSTDHTTELSPTHYVWVQLATLGAGMSTLAVAHTVTRGMDDSVSGITPGAAGVLLVVIAASMFAVVRSIYVMVTAAFSDAYRVFRSRHLLACGALLLAIAAAATAAVIIHDPFDKLFAHGRITGEDLVDVSIVVAALACMVGAGVALTGAWETSHDERHWHRSLPLP